MKIAYSVPAELRQDETDQPEWDDPAVPSPEIMKKAHKTKPPICKQRGHATMQFWLQPTKPKRADYGDITICQRCWYDEVGYAVYFDPEQCAWVDAEDDLD